MNTKALLTALPLICIFFTNISKAQSLKDKKIMANEVYNCICSGIKKYNEGKVEKILEKNPNWIIPHFYKAIEKRERSYEYTASYKEFSRRKHEADRYERENMERILEQKTWMNPWQIDFNAAEDFQIAFMDFESNTRLLEYLNKTLDKGMEYHYKAEPILYELPSIRSILRLRKDYQEDLEGLKKIMGKGEGELSEGCYEKVVEISELVLKSNAYFLDKHFRRLENYFQKVAYNKIKREGLVKINLNSLSQEEAIQKIESIFQLPEVKGYAAFLKEFESFIKSQSPEVFKPVYDNSVYLHKIHENAASFLSAVESLYKGKKGKKLIVAGLFEVFQPLKDCQYNYTSDPVTGRYNLGGITDEIKTNINHYFDCRCPDDDKWEKITDAINSRLSPTIGQAHHTNIGDSCVLSATQTVQSRTVLTKTIQKFWNLRSDESSGQTYSSSVEVERDGTDGSGNAQYIIRSNRGDRIGGASVNRNKNPVYISVFGLDTDNTRESYDFYSSDGALYHGGRKIGSASSFEGAVKMAFQHLSNL